MTKKASKAKSPPSKSYTKVASFKWNDETTAVALALADGKTREEAAAVGNISLRTVYNWLDNPEFAAEVDRLTLMVGIAGRAERIRIAKRVISQKTNGNLAVTEKDLLEWLKFAQSETDGAKLDLTKLAETLGG